MCAAATAAAAGTALSEEPQLGAYKSVTADGADWNLETPLNTFATIAIVGGLGDPGTSGNKWKIGAAYGQVAGIAARPVTVEVVDEKVKISVLVRQTDDISAQPENWPKVDLSKVDVDRSEDNERIILTIPVSAAQGFFQIGTGAE